MCKTETTSTGGEKPNTMTKPPFEFLPTDVYPMHYQVSLLPSLYDYIFDGCVRIDLKINSTSPITTFRLNAAELDIHQAYIALSTVNNTAESLSSNPTYAITSFEDMNDEDKEYYRQFQQDTRTTKRIIPLSFTVDKETESVIFTLETPLNITEHSQYLVSCYIAFSGELNDKLHGFYRSTYKTRDGKDGIMATTQFEAVDARRAFPCFDEPSIKSRFQISLYVPSDVQAYSNTSTTSITNTAFNQHNISESFFENVYTKPLFLTSQISKPSFTIDPFHLRSKNSTKQETQEEACIVQYDFASTKKISSYLVAFVVGQFDTARKIYTSIDGRSIPVTVSTPPNLLHKAEYPLEVAMKSVEFFEKWFNIPYPFTKCDNFAIPDFAAGAMENAGCIFYRDSFILVDRLSTSLEELQETGLTVAHEISHQWFGNLVTMEWWSDLWLNEGFATWAEYECIDICYPNYNIWSQYLESSFISAYRVDSLCSTHPVEADVHHPDEIDEIFDSISYSKGCAVVKMVADYMGPNFQHGIRCYLEKYRWKNARTKDLWQQLEDVSKLPIAEMMKQWTQTSGFPYLTLTHDATTNTLEFTQKRFFATKHSEQLSTEKHGMNTQTWLVPLALYVCDNASSQPTNKVVLRDITSKLTLPELVNDPNFNGKYVLFNSNMSTLTHINYPPTWWSEIIQDISKLERPAVYEIETVKMCLLNDAISLVKYGELDINILLQLILSIGQHPNETSPHVWSLLELGMKLILNIAMDLDRSTNTNVYQTKLSTLFYPLLKAQRDVLGLQTKEAFWMKDLNDESQESFEKHRKSLLRITISHSFTRFYDSQIVDEVCSLVDEFYAKKGYIDEPTPEAAAIIDADVRTQAFIIAMKSNPTKYINIFLSMLEETTTEEGVMRILNALAYVDNEDDCLKVLDIITTAIRTPNEKSFVRSQNIPSGIRAMGSNFKIVPCVWNYIKKHYDDVLYAKYSRSSNLRGIIGVIVGVKQIEVAHDIEDFFKHHEYKGAESYLPQCFEAIYGNIELVSKYSSYIKEYLDRCN